MAHNKRTVVDYSITIFMIVTFFSIFLFEKPHREYSIDYNLQAVLVTFEIYEGGTCRGGKGACNKCTGMTFTVGVFRFDFCSK